MRFGFTDDELIVIREGRSARAGGCGPSVCQYSEHRGREERINRHLWLAGWHDHDMELKGIVSSQCVAV